MIIIKVKDYKEMSQKAAEIIINSVLKKPDIVLGFATGSTPLGLYKQLVKVYKKKKINFSKIRAFNLDEYYPIKKNDKKSFYSYLFKNVFDDINIKKSNINLLNGEAKDSEKECKNYENKIKKNPIDIQILGIGENGHIAFNEPCSSFSSRTRLVTLSPKVLKSKKIPKKALTVGVSTIMKTKKIILLASGKNKAKAIKSMLKEKINKKCPASFLRKHKNLIVIFDKRAGSLL